MAGQQTEQNCPNLNVVGVRAVLRSVFTHRDLLGDVQKGEKENPNNVDEMPIKTDVLNPL